MEGGMPGGAKGGYRSLQLSEGRGHGFEMLIAFDPLPHCDFGNHFPLVARRIVGDIGPVDGDDRRADRSAPKAIFRKRAARRETAPVGSAASTSTMVAMRVMAVTDW
jgi:hypothetical protein